MGERLRSYIDIEETPHFRLTADERCPLLNTNGLCDLITAAGQDALCQICADHPRFRNILSDREETGLGLCCEAAVSLILKKKQPARLLISEENGPKRHLSRKDAAMLQKRDLWITFVQDRTLSIDARIARLCEMEALQLPACGWADWAQLYLNLERLNPAWEKELTLLCSEKAAVPPADEALQIALEQLLVYLLYRHIAAAEDAHELRPRLAFCLLSTQLLIRLAALHKAEAALPWMIFANCRACIPLKLNTLRRIWMHCWTRCGMYNHTAYQLYSAMRTTSLPFLLWPSTPRYRARPYPRTEITCPSRS